VDNTLNFQFKNRQFDSDIIEETVLLLYGGISMTKTEYNNNPNHCLFCNASIFCLESQTLSDIKKKKFCNHSCAAKYSNYHRQKKKYYCQKCGAIICEGFENYTGRKYCNTCSPNYADWTQITYGEAKEKRLYQVNSRIRELARQKFCKTHELKCAICGYDKHVEIHHIKGISTFSDDTPISIINEDSNLIALCPNHHWEIENGLLEL
jgi:hypothetical protein